MLNLTGEVQSVRGSEPRQIKRCPVSPIRRLPTWVCQPGNRNGPSVGIILNHRKRTTRAIKGSASRKRYPAVVFEACHLASRVFPAENAGIDLMRFPVKRPFFLDEVSDLGYRPCEANSLTR